MNEAKELHEFFSEFYCDFIPKDGEVIITDKKNILSNRLKANYVSSLELTQRVAINGEINHPFFLLPNRVKFLKEVFSKLQEEEDVLLLNGNSFFYTLGSFFTFIIFSKKKSFEL